ncbi:MAG: hypothetical protein NVSMB65_11350 [Chloroflexota bacterium]
MGYYGVQYNGTVLATTDGGHGWHQQSVGTKWGLRGIACVSVATCYSVGYAETSVVTTDGGRTWRDPHTPRSPQALAHVACATRLTCIAAGSSPGAYTSLSYRILLTTDGAHTWSYPRTPIDRTAFPMYGVACPGARVCYVVGAYATILVTQDAGRTWEVQHNPAMDSSGLIPPLTSVACASQRACMAVGGFPDSGLILTTDDGGHTWTRQPSPARAALNSVTCPSAQACYVMGSSGTIVQTRDGGRTWTLLDSGTSTSLNSIACTGTSHCIVVGNAGFIATLPLSRHAPPTPPQRRPSITIVKAGLYQRSSGQAVWTTTVAQGTTAYFAVYFTVKNAGSYLIDGRLSIIHEGRTEYTGRIGYTGTTPDGILELAGGVQLGTVAPGHYIARLTVLVGPVQETRAVAFTVVGLGATPQPNPTPGPGQPTPQATSGTTPGTCAAWNVAGTWQFQSMTMGNGSATLQQSATTVSGSLDAGGVTWTLQGSIQGATVTLDMTAPGQVAQSFQGMVSGDGATISGNVGTFSGGHATCAH